MGFADAFNSFASSQIEGQKILADLDERKAQTEQRRAATANQLIENKVAQLSMDNKKALGDWMQANQAEQEAGAVTSAGLAKQFQKATQFAANRGDFDGAKEMGALAQNQLEDASREQTQTEKTRLNGLEVLSSSAQDVMDNPTPEAHQKLFKAALTAGYNPMDIPTPGTPQYDAFVKTSKLASMTGSKRLEYQEKVREYDQKQAAIKAERDARREERAAQRSDLASYREASLGLKKDLLDFRKDQAETKLAAPPKVSSTMERQAVAVTNAANEAGQGLFRTSQMMSGTTNGVFGHLEDPKTILKALTSTGTNKLTPENVQMFQANSGLLGLEIAQAMAAPYKPNKEQVSEAQRRFEINPGDTEYTAMYKIALAADVLRTRMQSAPKVEWLKEARDHADSNLSRFPSAAEVYEHAKARGVKLKQFKAGKSFEDRFQEMMSPDQAPAAAPAKPSYAPSAADRSLLDQYAPQR